MKKEYQKPLAQYISLAAADRIATNEGYYAEDAELYDGIGPGVDTDVVSNPFD